MRDDAPTEARFRLALRAARQGAWEFDLRTGHGSRSPELLHLLGVGNDRPSLGDYLANVAPEERDRVLDAFTRLGRGETDESVLQYRYVRDDGARIWVEQHALLERDAAGRPQRIYGLTRDITLEKEAELQLQARVEERTRELEARTAALDAFVAFTEAIGVETDVALLGRRAVEVVHARYPSGSAAYYERADGVWKARVWTPDVPADLAALIAAGLPDTPLIRRVVEARAPVFVDAWDEGQQEVRHSAEYSAVVNIPLIVDGEVRGILALGLREARPWSSGDRALLRAVHRGLHLALERAAQARRLEAEGAEVTARNEVLAAFENWTRDLVEGEDAPELIRRAQRLLYDRLPVEAVLYYERDGDRWFVRDMLGEYGSEGLRRAHEAGLPHATTLNLRVPYERREVLYQGPYDVETDGLAEHMRHVGATAILPLRTARGVRGLFGVAKFEQADWTEVERTFIETVARSLEVALDRADKTAELERERRALAERTAALASANEELEAFAYSVSHDLRTPVRHILGFTELLRKSVGTALDEKAARYLGVVDEAARRMNTLIDAMLDLSRTSRAPLRPAPVDLDELVRQVLRESEPELLGREVRWDLAPLPVVTGDAATLRLVLANLVANALKYTRDRDVATVRLWAEDRPNETAVFVADNGVGFDPRYAHKLFGVFQRLHRAEDFEGTGVGLANVRRIVHRHGGAVTAEGEIGRGAIFGFTLPKAPD